MKTRVPDFLLNIKLRALVCGFRPWSLLPSPSSLLRRRGQTTVEYALMLAVVAAMAISVFSLLAKPILGGLFTIVGSIVGSETPA
jgi:Flp pilus assembly pilin Flp